MIVVLEENSSYFFTLDCHSALIPDKFLNLNRIKGLIFNGKDCEILDQPQSIIVTDILDVHNKILEKYLQNESDHLHVICTQPIRSQDFFYRIDKISYENQHKKLKFESLKRIVAESRDEAIFKSAKETQRLNHFRLSIYMYFTQNNVLQIALLYKTDIEESQSVN